MRTGKAKWDNKDGSEYEVRYVRVRCGIPGAGKSDRWKWGKWRLKKIKKNKRSKKMEKMETEVNGEWKKYTQKRKKVTR